MDSLRTKCGDSEFGYRMQAMFAHILLRQGAVILEINAQGHPDIRARTNDREILVQVKTTSHHWSNPSFLMSDEDLVGISEQGRRDGWLAFLDCALPVEWILVAKKELLPFANTLMQVETLRAISDQPKSTQCTRDFFDIMQKMGERVFNLSYKILRTRALKNEPLLIN